MNEGRAESPVDGVCTVCALRSLLIAKRECNSMVAAVMMEMLHNACGGYRPARLAALLSMTHANCMRLLRRLERKGLVYVRKCRARRGTLEVRLTEHGERLLDGEGGGV